MSIHTAGTHENIVLAQNVNGRLRAESRIIFAKAFMHRAIGAGFFAALAGIGIGAASYGWATLNQFDTAAEKIAAAMQAALSDVTLKTKGEVSLTNTTLKLEQPVAAAAPQSNLSSVLAKQKDENGNAAVKTTFSIFKSVDYLDGSIVTNWVFQPNASVPDNQLCYFIHQKQYGSRVMEKIDVAVDGNPLTESVNGVNPQVLAKNCIWFDKSKI